MRRYVVVQLYILSLFDAKVKPCACKFQNVCPADRRTGASFVDVTFYSYFVLCEFTKIWLYISEV
jgi:hypothetical protein